MRKLFKLLVLAGLVYAGWWFWKNYDLSAWYTHVKNAIDRRDTRSALVLPKKRGESLIQPNTIYIKAGCEFSPEELVIQKGERVTWQNTSAVAQEIVGAEFDLKIIQAGRPFVKTFNENGSFNFNCANNERTKGQIIVK